MALNLPWPYVGGVFGKPGTLDELADRVQQNFEAIANQFPIGGANTKRVPQVRVYNNANISVNNATSTSVTFNSQEYDIGTSAAQHSTSVNTNRLTCRVDGVYHIAACIGFAVNGTGTRLLELWVDGTTPIAVDSRAAAAAATYGTLCSVSTQYRLTAGQYVEVKAVQSSGGALDVVYSASYSPWFSWHWLSA